MSTLLKQTYIIKSYLVFAFVLQLSIWLTYLFGISQPCIMPLQVIFIEHLLARMCHYQHGQINSFLKPMLQRDFISALPGTSLLRLFVVSSMGSCRLKWEKYVKVWKMVELWNITIGWVVWKLIWYENTLFVLWCRDLYKKVENVVKMRHILSTTYNKICNCTKIMVTFRRSDFRL